MSFCNDIMTVRHSFAHVLAACVQEICPGVKFGIGPAIDEGMYYDFLVPENFSFSAQILKQIKNKMKKFIRENHVFVQNRISLEAARKKFAQEPFKLELIDRLEKEEEKEVGVYQVGNFIDLCKGPHVEHSGVLQGGAWKLDRVSGAYWNGNEKNPAMQRVYALVFDSKEKLESFERRREEAAKRDHRKLGAELELFMFSDLIGKGMPMFLPKGATLRRILERFVVDEELKRGYSHVNTPPIGKKDLYKISGHVEHYDDGMYPTMDMGAEYVLRPMSCPHHFMMYKHKPKSYRELPLRLAEIAPLFRRERSGELSGLSRIMLFHLADSHIICREDQVKSEFINVIRLVDFIMKKLGIDSIISYQASLRDPKKGKYIDDEAMWIKGEKLLLDILDKEKIPYKKSPGDAAFYGPKLDIQMRNVYGKEETVFTIQIDFVMPERFDLSYIDKDNKKKRPVVIHRSSIGCLERTIAFLIEYYKGAFPLWFAPEQVRILSLRDTHVDCANHVYSELLKRGIRVEKDIREENISRKIKEARHQRIPYLVIIGDKEVESSCISVRNRDSGKQNVLLLQAFLENIEEENKQKSLQLSADIVK